MAGAKGSGKQRPREDREGGPAVSPRSPGQHRSLQASAGLPFSASAFSVPGLGTRRFKGRWGKD